MEVVLLARAEADIFEGQARLEDAWPGLGDRFSAAVEAALDRLQTFPEAGPIYARPFRRLVIRDFPFGIFYSIEGKRVMVQTVSDLRQDPEAIRRQLGLK